MRKREFTTEQSARLETHNEFMKHIERYRTKNGIGWGGPPYSEKELKYARSKMTPEGTDSSGQP